MDGVLAHEGGPQFNSARFLEPIQGSAISLAGLITPLEDIHVKRTHCTSLDRHFVDPRGDAGPCTDLNGYDNQDSAVTQGYAPFEGGGYPNGSNYGIPVVGPVFGVLTAPFTVATGGWAQPNTGCFLDRDFNGRYTARCGM